MARSANRWGDDDRDEPAREPRRRDKGKGGTSPITIILLVLGGVFVLGVVACGGLMFLGFRKAEQQVRQGEGGKGEGPTAGGPGAPAQAGGGGVPGDPLPRPGGPPPPQPGGETGPRPPPP